LDQLQSNQLKKAEQIQRDVQDNFERQISTVKLENLHLKEAIRDIQSAHTNNRMMAFGRPMTGPHMVRQQEMSMNEQEEEEELIAHFQNFNMADIAADEKSAMKSDRETPRQPSAIKPSPLEEENRTLREMVDSLSKELSAVKEKLQTQNNQAEEERKEALYELRRELFKVQQDNRRLEMELSLYKSDEALKKEQKAYQEMAQLKSDAEELKMEVLKKESDISALLTRNRALEAQLITLRQERDRLIDVSSELKIKLHQNESRNIMPMRTPTEVKVENKMDFGVV
jgi:hypothetical protein